MRLVESSPALVLGVDDNRVGGDGLRRDQQALHRIGHGEIANAGAFRALMSRELADERGGDGLVPGKPVRQLVREALHGEGEHAEAVDNDARLVDRNENPGKPAITPSRYGRAW